MKRRIGTHNFRDLTGQTFGRWIVVSRAENPPRGHTRWLCRCDCGTERIVDGNSLKRGASTSCGCLHRERVTAYNIQNLTGMTFGFLTVLHLDENDPKGKTVWLCRCECGREKLIRACYLVNGHTASCGCMHRVLISANRATHGHARVCGESPTYQTWRGMVERCFYPGNKYYASYGGRGITICDRWRDFQNFLDDMGERPTGTTIDRVENDGNYEPGNCRWATDAEQSRNKRNNRPITFEGKTMILSDWAKAIGITRTALHCRIRKWGVERALTTPRLRSHAGVNTLFLDGHVGVLKPEIPPAVLRSLITPDQQETVSGDSY